MAGITQTIPSYMGGISEQPDQLKLPGQVKDAINAIPDPIDGLYKRPGAKRIGTVPITNVQTGGSWFHYYRDETEGSYIIQVASNGRVRVWKCNDGTEVDVEYDTAGQAYNASDADHTKIASSTSPSDAQDPTDTHYRYLAASDPEDIQACTVNDTTFLNNRTKQIKTLGTTASRPNNNFAFIDLIRTENGRQYGINIYDDESNLSTLNRATKLRIVDDNLAEGGGTGPCTGIGTQVFTVTADHTVHTVSTSNVNTSNETITINSHGWTNGQAIQYIANGTVIGGLNAEERLYVLAATTNTFKVERELGGGAINLTGTGNNSQEFTDIADPNKWIKNSAGTHVTSGKDNLTFRLTTNGQQGALNSQQPGYGDITAGQDYQCSYRREIILLHGGEGWVTGDRVRVSMDQAGGANHATDTGQFKRFRHPASYTVEVQDHESIQVKGRFNGVTGAGIIRPAPTPFDADTAVTPDTIIGSIQSALPATITGTVIGNGLYLSSTNDFNVEVVDLDLMRVMQGEINDVGKLPLQCKQGYIVQISNAENSGEDDYYVKFAGENGKDGPGTWKECAAPGIVEGFNPITMPHVLQRQANGKFLVKKFEWEIRKIGDDTTNAGPSFLGSKGTSTPPTYAQDRTINKVAYFRNRLVLLSGENVICSRPGTIDKPDFWAFTALTVSASDPIDIACASTYPSDLFDSVELTTGLLCFSTNEQFLLSADEAVLNPDTAKLRSTSTFNYNKNIPPLDLGMTVGWVDNSNKYSRFVESANIVREGEPTLVESSKIVPTLLEKDIDLLTNSRENGIVLFGKTNSSTVFAYKYFGSAEKREQASWFKIKHKNPIKYHFLVEDKYYFLDTDNFLQSMNLTQATADPSIDQDSINYLIHLDNYVTLTGGVWNATTRKTTFTNGTGGAVLNWLTSVTNSQTNLAIVDIDSNAARVGRYAKPTILTAIGGNQIIEVEGDWSTGTFYIGYLYDYSVIFPRFYRITAGQGSSLADVNASLIIHRMKLNFGKIGLYKTTLTRVGKADYNEVHESAILPSYGVDDAPYLEEEVKTIPIYEKNTNVKVTLSSTHPAPATLHSMSWEGDYSPMHYRRV